MSWMLSCIGCGTKRLPDREETRFLDFQHCLLKTVPFEVFQNERILQELILDCNQIAELPRELFLCHELCILSLSDNELQSLPAAISSLINLQSLNFCKNGISDIPDNIKACKKLSRVDASTNPLCRIPEGVTQLVSLKELCLNDTFLDYLPANFGRLTGLEVLELRENQLNTLPRSMTRLTSLRKLDLGQNEYSELPEVVGHLTSLTDLWFDGNKIKSIPFDIGNLTELRFMDASRNRIQEIFPEIGSCKNLTDLYVNSNELESLPDEICECKCLTTLCLDENLIGQLPDNLGELDKLTELNVSHNELVELPSSIGLLRELRVLHVSHNMLEQLPPELGSCFHLIILTAAHNQITHLPPELANISRLRVINACGNQIQFLPVSFTKLQVTGLWLSENQNKPTVPMQCKIDNPTGQKVLTCYMLPQLPYEEKIYKDDSNELPVPEAEVTRRRAKSLIHFASDKDNEKSGLARIPTPYPKELRALARHTKNLKSLTKASSSSRNEMVPTITPVKHNKSVEQKEVESSSFNKMPSSKVVPSENTEEIALSYLSPKPEERTELNARSENTAQILHKTVEPFVQEKVSNQKIEKMKSKEKEDNTDNNHKTIETQDVLVAEEKINSVSLHSDIEVPDTKIVLNNSNENKDKNLSPYRPASIAAPERSQLEEAVGSISHSGYKFNWQHQRPGSLASSGLSNHIVYQQEIPYHPVHDKIDAHSLSQDLKISPHSEEITQDDHIDDVTTTKHSSDDGELVPLTQYQRGPDNIKNSPEEVYSKPIVENNQSVLSEEYSPVENQTKILPTTCPQPTDRFYSQFSSDKFSTKSPSKSTQAKVAYQSKLPTLATPNKNSPHQTSEILHEISKSRIPSASPVADSPMASSMKNSSENFISPGKMKKTGDSPHSFESRIPSFSAKHSAFGMSPVEKPINTTGIPAISPPRDSVINSSLKKKSGIPLSKSKPIGHQVSPADKGLKSPRSMNQAWK